MKKIFAFITKANQVLLFALLIIAIGAFLMETVFKRKYQSPEPSIRVVEEVTESEASAGLGETYSVHYSGKADTSHVFDLQRSFIESETLRRHNPVLASSKGAFSSPSSENQTVNVLFFRDNESKVHVFNDEVFVVDMVLPEYFDKTDFDPSKMRCVYSVITKDSNADGFLTPEDQVDMYATNTSGEGLELIAEGINEYYLRSQHSRMQIFVSMSSEAKETYLLYSLHDGRKRIFEIEKP